MPEDSENSTEMTMADYSVLCENQQIEIGKAGENLARSCTIDYSAWLKEYGEGDLRIRAIRSGDAEPYPVTNVTTENGVATWTFTDADTAVKGYGEVQIMYYVEDVMVKSRVWRTYTHRSLSTSSEEVPDPYQDWLSEVERIGSQIEEDAESASDSATRAAGSASEAAESALSAARSESSAQEYASEASASATSAESSASAASQSASDASTYEYYSEQYMNEAKSARFSAESAKNAAETAKTAAQTAATESEASATAAAQSAAQAEETAESIEESADLIQKLMDNQIKDTATGTIASFPDGAEFNAVSLIADIDPIQDTSGGSPSPTHICPISGWDSVDVSVAGKNLLPNEKYQLSEINVIIGQTDGAYSTYLKAGTYKISAKANAQIGIFYRKSDGTSNIRIAQTSDMAVGTFTVADDGYYRFWAYNSSGVNASDIEWFQLELGSTATAYEPYQRHTYHTTLPQTVYGGTLDVVSGELIVDRAMVTFDGTENWYNVDTSGTDRNRALCLDIDSPTGQYNWNLIGNYITPTGNAESYPQLWKANINAAGHLLIGIPKTIATITEWKAYLAQNPLQLCYELATPQTYQLTPQDVEILKGRNNVWANSGDVTVEYIADTKLYIQKAMGAIG